MGVILHSGTAGWALVWDCWEIPWARPFGFNTLFILQIVFDRCYSRAILFQAAGAEQVVGNDMHLRTDIRTEIDLVEIGLVDPDDRLLEDAGQDTLDIRASPRLRSAQAAVEDERGRFDG